MPLNTYSYEEYEALTETEYLSMLQVFLTSAVKTAEGCLPKLSKPTAQERFWRTLIQNTTRMTERARIWDGRPSAGHRAYYKAFTRTLALEKWFKFSEPIEPTRPLWRQVRTVLGCAAKLVNKMDYKSNLFVSELSVNKGMAFVLTKERRIGWVDAK